MTLGIWAFATVLAIALPVVETGSDPTQLPLGAFSAPVAAAIAGAVKSVFRRGPGPR